MIELEVVGDCRWIFCFSIFFLKRGLCLLGVKRSFGDLDDDEDDIFGTKKVSISSMYCFRTPKFVNLSLCSVFFWFIRFKLTLIALFTLKGNLKVEETAPGVATGMILSLRERYCYRLK